MLASASLSREYGVRGAHGRVTRYIARGEIVLGCFSRFVLLTSVAGLCGLAMVADLYGQPRPQAPVARPNPNVPPPQGTSRGENFSNKHPAQLFATDCTGAGCHRSPQGLAKGQQASSLTSFLREHYTNSRDSAASLAGYLLGNPRAVAPVPGPAEAARTQPGVHQTQPGAQPQQQAGGRNQRGRQAAAPPAPPAEPPAPPPPQFDIFD
jgi:hypothetical protein